MQRFECSETDDPLGTQSITLPRTQLGIYNILYKLKLWIGLQRLMGQHYVVISLLRSSTLLVS